MSPETEVEPRVSGEQTQEDGDPPDDAIYLASVVFLRRNIRETFEYKTRYKELVGKPVVVPLGPKLTVGLVTDVKVPDELDEEVKPVRDVIETVDSIPEELIDLGKWISQYYVCPVNNVYEAILPPRYLPDPDPAWVRTGDHSPEHEILSEMNEGVTYPLERLKKIYSGTVTDLQEKMEDYEEEGYVKRSLYLDPPDVSTRTYNFVEFKDTDYEDWKTQASKRQSELIEYLEEHGSQLQKDLPEPLRRTSLLQRLEDEEIIERSQKKVR
ncbi:MAG: hypothetical protein ABEJ65_09845, partial [bacterium]